MNNKASWSGEKFEDGAFIAHPCTRIKPDITWLNSCNIAVKCNTNNISCLISRWCHLNAKTGAHAASEF